MSASVSAPTVSVVVVSRHRPEALARCMAGLRQQDHPGFELVVVTDPAGMAVAGPGIKAVSFDQANISQARNLGVAAAAGELVAFLDDDAVPEPTWLTRLVAPFADSGVAAAAGYVRGRDGIALEWQAQVMGADARAQPLAADGTQVSVHPGVPGRGIVTIGTNMAFRRSVLAGIGGFDPAFRYFLDESDLNMRLAAAGCRTAIVPLAQVHHSAAASERRRSDRAPRSLHEVGASTAVFLRKHAPEPVWAGLLSALVGRHRRTALRRMVSGRIEPRDVGRLMRTLAEGIADGMVRDIAPLPVIGVAAEPFLRFGTTGPLPGRVLAGWAWRGKALRAEARKLGAAGTIVTLFAFTPTLWQHSAGFHPDGYWEQRGGLFRRSDATGSLFLRIRLRDRVERECARLASLRPVS